MIRWLQTKIAVFVAGDELAELALWRAAWNQCYKETLEFPEVTTALEALKNGVLAEGYLSEPEKILRSMRYVDRIRELFNRRAFDSHMSGLSLGLKERRRAILNEGQETED